MVLIPEHAVQFINNCSCSFVAYSAQFSFYQVFWNGHQPVQPDNGIDRESGPEPLLRFLEDDEVTVLGVIGNPTGDECDDDMVMLGCL